MTTSNDDRKDCGARKILLDHMIDWRVIRELPPEWEVHRASDMGWSEHDNGVLLRLAAREGFDLLLTLDQKMELRIRSAEVVLPVIVMIQGRNTLSSLAPLMDEVAAMLRQKMEAKFHYIGDPSRVRKAMDRVLRNRHGRSRRDD